MANSYKEIDVEKWIRRTTYKWFKDFTNPTYCFNVKIDVSDVISFSKETRTSFFINFLYVICRVFNELEPLRLRLVDDHVLLYERIDPTFTVKTKDGSFNNAEFQYTSDYNEFYKLAKEEINRRSEMTDNSQTYNKSQYDVFYSSCITSLEIESLGQPLNFNDRNSLNVPRIFWDKYRLDNDKYVMLLSINVSHALVDGEELSAAFNLIKKYCTNFKENIK